MATSQNGWPVIFDSNDSRVTAIPKILGKVRSGDVAVIFTALVKFIDDHVEDVDMGRDDWGGNVRPIRGKTKGYSNHASYTAIDVNAVKHGRGAEGTWNASQQKLIRDYLKNTLEGVVRWGEDYNRKISKVDGMHFEINAGASAVARVANKLRRGGRPGTTPTVQKPRPIPGVDASVVAKLKGMGYKTQTAKDIGDYQKAHGLVDDMVWGPKTESKYQLVVRTQDAVKRMMGVPKDWASDGYWGKTSRKWAGYTSGRNRWGNPNGALTNTFIDQLKKVGAWK